MEQLPSMVKPFGSHGGEHRRRRRWPKGRRWLRPLWKAYALWLRVDCVDLSAAFAYHMLQSFFPALLIVLSFFSLFLGTDDALLNRLLDQVAQILPPANMPVFELILERFTRQGFGAGLLGVLLLVVSANNIYLTLQRGADRIWWNRPFDLPALAWDQLVIRFIRLRLKAFALLVIVTLLLLIDQVLGHLRVFGFKMLRQWLMSDLPPSLHWIGSLSGGADLFVSLLIGWLVALLFLWLLPSRSIPLRPLLPSSLMVGTAITSLNLLLGRILIPLGLRFQAYGVVGGVLILTLWIWLVGVILYYGQCLGVVLAHPRSGGRSAPASVLPW